MSSDKAYSAEQRLNAIIGLIYSDGTHQESIGTPAQGVDLQIYDLATPPAAPTAGSKVWSQTGNLVYTGEDTNVYATGELYMLAGGAQNVVSTTPVQYGACSCAVSAGTYRIDGMLVGTMGAFTDSAFCRFNGPAVSAGRINGLTQIAGGGTPGVSTMTTMGSGNLTTGSVTGGGTVFIMAIDGWFTFSAGGTLAFMVMEAATTTHTWNAVDAFFDIKPT